MQNVTRSVSAEAQLASNGGTIDQRWAARRNSGPDFSPNVTTTGPHDLLIGFFGDTSGSGTITAGSGYTMQLTDVNFYTGAEDQLNVAAGTYNATATMPTSDAGWIGIVASFK